MPAEKPLTPYEAARLLGVHPSTLRRHVAAGRLPEIRTPGGHHRYRRSDLERFLYGLGRPS